MFSRIVTISIISIALMASIGCKNNSSEANSSEGAKMEEVLDKMEKEKPNAEPERLSYTVSLGVMPDMNYEGEGMLIGHVNEGRPGQNAGLMKGDVVMELGGQKIEDLVSYTKILGSFKEGDETKIVVKRGEDLLTMLVEF